MFGKTSKTEVVAPNAAKTASKSEKNSILFGILGIWVALAIVSIVYSTTVILLGTSGLTSRIMIVPQAVTAGVVTIIAFYKIFK